MTAVVKILLCVRAHVRNTPLLAGLEGYRLDHLSRPFICLSYLLNVKVIFILWVPPHWLPLDGTDNQDINYIKRPRLQSIPQGLPLIEDPPWSTYNS